MSRDVRFSVGIVNFHHARGPEVETWIGVEDETEIAEWPLLPFLALADGAHSSEEDFSYFTLKSTKNAAAPTTLFGISCTRQLDSRELLDRPPDVTRSTVQKAVVVITDNPTHFFGHLRQQLSAVTAAWFAQKNFEDLEIIRRFQESLQLSLENDPERMQYIGLSLRELVYEFKHQTLVLFKCMLLQPKMLFFGSRCERLCMTQFSLLSLVPGLLGSLQDCGDPELNSVESTLSKPSSVRTSDRKSLLAFMGLPLQLFGKGSLFGPYTPLQQLDILADVGTKSYVIGSTNSLLLQQKDRYSDILINLDEGTINITSTSLRSALALSAADRRWIDALVNSVLESWDEADPSRPKTLGFIGSEDYIRLQFEEYILSMVSAVKYHLFLEKHSGSDQNVFLPEVDGDPATDFNMEWVDYWKRTENFRIFQKFTDSELFDLVPPKHVMAGGLTMEDVQRRIAQQVQDLRLDEKVSSGKEAVAKTWASSRASVSSAISSLSERMEYYREQRRLREQQASDSASEKQPGDSTPASPTVSEPARASAYISSWSAWAAEKRKTAFTKASNPDGPKTPDAESPRKSFFNRWSKSSTELVASQPEDSTRGTASVDAVRETIWDGEKVLPDKAASVIGVPGMEKPTVCQSSEPVSNAPSAFESKGAQQEPEDSEEAESPAKDALATEEVKEPEAGSAKSAEVPEPAAVVEPTEPAKAPDLPVQKPKDTTAAKKPETITPTPEAVAPKLDNPFKVQQSAADEPVKTDTAPPRKISVGERASVVTKHRPAPLKPTPQPTPESPKAGVDERGRRFSAASSIKSTSSGGTTGTTGTTRRGSGEMTPSKSAFAARRAMFEKNG